MKAHHPLHILGLMILATPGFARSVTTAQLSPAETKALRSYEDPALGELRAGAFARKVELPTSERTALVRAESKSSDLGEMRAGSLDLSDRDLTIIAIVVGIVLILVLL